MRCIEVRKFGAWHIATAIGVLFDDTGLFCGWAKMGPITGTSPIDEPGKHVWFEFGRTRAEVIDKLRQELGITLIEDRAYPCKSYPT